mgnify:FL=1|tara:strand:- start:913 stop:1440 length:528 start_codon:yes stop_codon:yes gene_type:complete
MNLKKAVFIIISFFIFSLNPSLAEVNLVYFDVEKVISNSAAGKSVKSQMEKINKSNIEKFRKKEEQLKNDEKNIIAKKNILSKEDFQKEVIKLKQDVSKYNKERNTIIKDTSIKGVKAMQKIVNLMNPILSDYAKEKNILIILDKKNIVMGKTELDITSDILKVVDKKVKTFTVK